MNVWKSGWTWWWTTSCRVKSLAKKMIHLSFVPCLGGHSRWMNSLEDWTRLPKPIVPVSPERCETEGNLGSHRSVLAPSRNMASHFSGLSAGHIIQFKVHRQQPQVVVTAKFAVNLYSHAYVPCTRDMLEYLLLICSMLTEVFLEKDNHV